MPVTSLTLLKVISVSFQSYIKHEGRGGVCPSGDIVRGTLIRECIVLPLRPTQPSIPRGSVNSTSFSWEGKGRYGSFRLADERGVCR